MNHLLKAVFADKHGKLVLFQWPNAPLISWGVLLIVAKLVHTNPIHTVANVGSFIAIGIWAVLELCWGATLFRRLLGGIVLVLSIISRF
ncbi:MAG TPA: hypothetical protein VN031_02675 [Candidatus Microsaccharimonas sp.]|nr:hypothetical protein [Candidatus Microsaccharimonas sp.]